MPVITLPDGSQKKFDAARQRRGSGGQHRRGPRQGRARGARRTASWWTRRSSSRKTRSFPSSRRRIRRRSRSSGTRPRTCWRQAVQSIYPKAQVTIGPVIEDGFYYDFAFERPFTPEDLEKFEAKMKEIAAAGPQGRPPRDAARRGRCAVQEHGRELQGRDHRQHSGQRGRSRCTGRASGSTCAAARTCHPPASSSPSSS